jgi:transcriptional regulator with XRE-family HTH domain
LVAEQRFAGESFFAALDAHRQSKRLTWRKVAMEAGVSQSTLTRMSQGKRPDVDTFGRLCRWAGLDADKFFEARKGQTAGEAEPLAMVSTYLRSDPNLSSEAATMLEQVVKAAYEQLRNKEVPVG